MPAEIKAEAQHAQRLAAGFEYEIRDISFFGYAHYDGRAAAWLQRSIQVYPGADNRP